MQGFANAEMAGGLSSMCRICVLVLEPMQCSILFLDEALFSREKIFNPDNIHARSLDNSQGVGSRLSVNV